jgi:hypothetical protein
LRRASDPATPSVPFVEPVRVYVPVTVQIERGLLRAPPSPNRLIVPPAGVWRNFADSDLRLVRAIAVRFGPLSRSGAGEGEKLALWRHLIDDLRELAGAWTAEGEVADQVAVSAAWAVAMQMQAQLGEEHQNNGGRFVSFGADGWAMVPNGMGEWWRLSAINSVYEMAPLRRCRWCGYWFSLLHQRADNQFCCARHRSAFHQKRQPPSAPWPEVI